MARLALLRHGHTAWNREGRLQGRTDIPLDEEARAELAGLALPAPFNSWHLVSSPLTRAVETAELVGGRSPQVHDALIEMDWGAWEGRKGADLIGDHTSGYRHLEEWGLSFQPPGGETVQALVARVREWLDALDRDTVAVCHIGVMRAFLCSVSNWTFLGPAPVQIKRKRLYVIDKEGIVSSAVPLEVNASCV